MNPNGHAGRELACSAIRSGGRQDQTSRFEDFPHTTLYRTPNVWLLSPPVFFRRTWVGCASLVGLVSPPVAAAGVPPEFPLRPASFTKVGRRGATIPFRVGRAVPKRAVAKPPRRANSPDRLPGAARAVLFLIPPAPVGQRVAAGRCGAATFSPRPHGTRGGRSRIRARNAGAAPCGTASLCQPSGVSRGPARCRRVRARSGGRLGRVGPPGQPWWYRRGTILGSWAATREALARDGRSREPCPTRSSALWQQSRTSPRWPRRRRDRGECRDRLVPGGILGNSRTRREAASNRR